MLFLFCLKLKSDFFKHIFPKLQSPPGTIATTDPSMEDLTTMHPSYGGPHCCKSNMYVDKLRQKNIYVDKTAAMILDRGSREPNIYVEKAAITNTSLIPIYLYLLRI